MQVSRMLRALLSPAALREAALDIRRGPYGDAFLVTRPWLRALGLVALGAALLIGLILLLGVAVGIAAAAGVQLIDPDILTGEADLGLDEEIRFIGALAVILFLMAVAVLGAAMIVYRRGPGPFLWPTPGGQWRLLGVGFVVLMAIGFIQWPIIAWLEPGGAPPLFDRSEPTQTRAIYALAAAIGLFAAAAARKRSPFAASCSGSPPP